MATDYYLIYPLNWPDHISVLLISILPTQRHQIRFRLASEYCRTDIKRHAARWVGDLVFKNYADGKKFELINFTITAFQDAWVQEKRNTIQTEKMICELVIMLAKLEKESWDRGGGQEDLGDA